MQYEQKLLHPRMIETNPVTCTPAIFNGFTSRYVSSVESDTLTAFSPRSTAPTRFGRSMYESGPATRSTPCFSTSSSLARSAMQPSTPTISRGRPPRFSDRKYCSRLTTRCSALSRTEHVFTNTASASSRLAVSS